MEKLGEPNFGQLPETSENIDESIVDDDENIDLKGKERYEPVPEGCLTNTRLSEIIRINPNRLKIIANKYRESNPGWFNLYINSKKRVHEYYHPDLVEKLKIDEEVIASKKERKTNPEASSGHKVYARIPVERLTFEILPEGWFLLSEIRKNYINLTAEKKDEALNDVERNHPEWTGMYKIEGKGWQKCLSPEGIREFDKKLYELGIRNINWKTAHQIAKELEADLAKIKEIAEEYRVTNPEWFRRYRDEMATFKIEYYSPELIAEIRIRLNKP